MTPERWQQITEVFHAALARDASTRGAFLDKTCASDRNLREEVEAMLDAHHNAGAFGEQPVFTASDALSDFPTTLKTSGAPAVSRRAPWWMYAVAASYIALFALIPYLVIWGPSDLLGFEVQFENGSAFLRDVDADSLPARAGVRSGDQLISIDSRPIRSVRDWTAFENNLEVGRTQRWEISRGGERLEFQITPERATWRNRVAGGYVSYTAIALISFAVGLFIGFWRPSDPVARVGAWFVATASIAFGLPNGWAVVWRQLPWVLQAVFWIPEISRFVLEGIFLSLFVIFPRRLFRARWLWIVIWAPVVATLPWRVAQFHAVIYSPIGTSGVPAWVGQAAFLRTTVYLVVAILILVVSYIRVLDPNQKRRVRVLMLGTAIGLSAAVAFLWNANLAGSARAGRMLVVLFIHPMLLACPLSFAYAILRHRVFDIQVIIRQGLQYALARGAVIGVLPALAVLLILDLAMNSQETLASMMQSRGWIYAGAGGLALIAYWQRKQWLEALDRRFFRERYNAQRVLRDVVEEIREARSFERVAPRVVARIETALHPEFVSLMMRQPDEPQYRSIASFPPGQGTLSVSGDSKLIALMRALEKPLDNLLSDSAWFERRLPAEESQWVRRARIDLLVPIAVGAGRKEALLAFGMKRSEEPYAREDQELLEAIASNLGFLLEQGSTRGKPAEMFEECPECGVCYDLSSQRCSSDGATLTPILLPRTLAGRYRLQRRRGRGGMGTVYEAVDGALERRVAVKVIRDDLVGSAEAAQRFRREARAAAGFAHPNVVTVFDYGVEGDTRGFLVMELLEGRSLRDELHQHGKLDPARTLSILRGVCGAVEAAHRRQLIHRDLKPENIFLSGQHGAGEVVKVLDFGIAKFVGPDEGDPSTRETAATHTGMLIGTPAYMSPEQLIGSSPDVQWDLWALAVVTYEVLVGARPFNSDSAGNWRNAILSGRFTRAPQARWNEFFAQSFDADVAKRPASAAEFLRQLEATL